MPRLPDPRFAPDCHILVDRWPVPARSGESVAAALLAFGRPLVSRSPKYHRPRGPFCLAGSCGTCAARIDGQPSQRTCRARCRDGLVVETQNAVPSAARDLLGIIDRIYRRGLDHHHLATWPRLANRAAVALSRALAGVGKLPGSAPPVPPPPAVERFDALVVGAGPAGLGAAEALAAAGRRVLLVDQERAIGGRLRCQLGEPNDPGAGWPERVAAAVRGAGGEVALGWAALGAWRDGGFPLVALAADRLRLARAPRLVLCPGGTVQPPLFEDNDLPGILSGRGLAAALTEHGTVPGERAAVLGAGAETEALAARLRRAGMEAAVVEGPVWRARGGRRLESLDLGDGSRLACDVAAVAGPPVPWCDLARQAGATVHLDPALGAHAVRAGPDGATGAPGVFAAGEVCGALSAGLAAEAGRRAGEAAGA